MTGSFEQQIAARTSFGRRIAGLVALVLAAAAVVLFTLGFWNPWNYVVLLRYFGSPAIGIIVIGVFGFVGSWLLLPIRNETTQRGRILLRVGAAITTVVGLICWGLFGPLFAPDITIRATAGDRTVAMVYRGELHQDLHVWVGSGLGARDVGSMGRPCGTFGVRFVSRDRVLIETNFGDWEIDLDPATGEPRQVLGPHCASGPVPATLGR